MQGHADTGFVLYIENTSQKGGSDVAMPNSLRVKFNSMRHKGRIDEAEYHALIKKLDGHDEQIRADERRKFAEWLTASYVITDVMGIRVWSDELLAEWQEGEE